jgi:hypothetical protein
MRLRDLDARFLYDVQPMSSRMSDSASVDGMQGVQFQCPSCGAGKERGEEDGRRFIRGAHYIQVLFANPRNVAPAPADAGCDDSHGGHPRWMIESGSTLDDLTLSPSINCDIPWKDAQGVEHPSACKFHGYVKNGDAA